MLEWCHLSHSLSGSNNLKRSNRLVLLVGVFLAIVAFVGILLLVAHEPDETTTSQPTTGSVVVATVDIPLSGARSRRPTLKTNRAPDSTRSRPGAFTDVSQVVGQIARQPVATGAQITADTISRWRPGRDRSTS